MRVPVTDHKSVKAHAAFEHVGDQALVPGLLHALPAREGDHHGLRIGLDRGDISEGVNVAQFFFADAGVTLVAPAIGRAVAGEVLGGRDDFARRHEIRRAVSAL